MINNFEIRKSYYTSDADFTDLPFTKVFFTYIALLVFKYK